jgi:hypothetical protein
VTGLEHFAGIAQQSAAQPKPKEHHMTTAPPEYAQHINVNVAYDGDTYWLACFGENPDSEHGDPIHPIDAGDTWLTLAAKVDNHVATCRYH